MLSITVGCNVKKYRLQKNWSQEQLAWKSDISVCTISRMERGIANPTLDIVESLSAALGVSVVFLVE